MVVGAAAGKRTGQILDGKYRILRLLGEGGMGAVYEAEHQWTHRRVAVKVLNPDYAEHAEAAQRFLREARSAAGISHPNVVDVLDMGQDPQAGSLYMVQTYLRGTDLRARLVQRRRLGLGETLDIVLPVMAGLSAAHARDIIHRDIKPENIFLAEEPSSQPGAPPAVIPKLIDFGIAKTTRATGQPTVRTRTGAILGTPYYMSPEQLRADEIDRRSDIWAMGVLLYELLTGRLPFDGPDQMAVICRIMMDTPPRIETIAPHVPPSVADAVHRALDKSREERFSTIEQFAAALRAAEAECEDRTAPDIPLLAERAYRTTDPSALAAGPLDAPSPSKDGASLATTRPVAVSAGARRMKVGNIAVIVGIVVAIAAGIAGWRVYRGQPRPDASDGAARVAPLSPPAEAPSKASMTSDAPKITQLAPAAPAAKDEKSIARSMSGKNASKIVPPRNSPSRVTEPAHTGTTSAAVLPKPPPIIEPPAESPARKPEPRATRREAPAVKLGPNSAPILR